jgi:hypothetical protein
MSEEYRQILSVCKHKDSYPLVTIRGSGRYFSLFEGLQEN